MDLTTNKESKPAEVKEDTSSFFTNNPIGMLRGGDVVSDTITPSENYSKGPIEMLRGEQSSTATKQEFQSQPTDKK